jgi:predicted enzyme related to lactoylglutathione lyase
MTKLSAFVIDCAHPDALASFYSAATGWSIESSSEDYASLSNGSVQLAFQKIDDYIPPAWPSSAKQAHVDITVADLAVAEKELLAAGATKPSFQPGGPEWTVLADPEGHVFCLVPEGE